MKIKSIIAIACMMLSCSTVVKAQDYEYPNHEISVGYGAIGATDIVSLLGDAIVGALSGSIDNLDTTGEISAQYLYNINKTWGIGAAVTFAETNGRDKDNTYKQKTDYIMVMPTVRAMWFHKKHFGMYSRVAVGGFLGFDSATKTDGGKDSKDTSTSGNFAFQLSPVCFEAGSNKVSGFFEAGFGFQGIFMAGIRFGL